MLFEETIFGKVDKVRSMQSGPDNPMYKHGAVGTRLYSIYTGMLKRCRQKSTNGYERYGGRGISVCEEWRGEHGFEHFRDWALSHGYEDELTLDRINTNGNYSPSNCKWSTREEQCNNRRSNVWLEYNGERHTMAQWARILNIPPATIKARYSKGWSIEDILFFHQDKPVGNPRPWTDETRRKQEILIKKKMKPIIQLTLDGVEIARFESLHEAERQTGISRSTIAPIADGRIKNPKHYRWKYVE